MKTDSQVKTTTVVFYERGGSRRKQTVEVQTNIGPFRAVRPGRHVKGDYPTGNPKPIMTCPHH